MLLTSLAERVVTFNKVWGARLIKILISHNQNNHLLGVPHVIFI